MTLFTSYDADGSGALDYNEFSAALFESENSKKVNSTTTGYGQNPEQLASALKTKLAGRGAKGLIGLQRQFKIMDDDNSHNLNKSEFNKAI
jgi:Ca2+-binding EF-hand superfamily protein